MQNRCSFYASSRLRRESFIPRIRLARNNSRPPEDRVVSPGALDYFTPLDYFSSVRRVQSFPSWEKIQIGQGESCCMPENAYGERMATVYVYVPLSCPGALRSARFSSNARRRLLVTDSVYSVRTRPSPISRCASSLLRDRMRVLCYYSVLVTAPTKDPSIFPQSRRKLASLYLTLYRLRLLYRSQLSSAQ